MVAPGDGAQGLTYEVSVPAFLAGRLAALVGKPVTFITYHYLEGQGQGSSFEPRLIGFLTRDERAFFELFTTVKGIGNRKALRAMAIEPGEIAAAVAAKKSTELTKLPEIGKRLAETIIAELSGKVERFMGGPSQEGVQVVPTAQVTGYEEEALLALIALGEARSDAERYVMRAVEKIRREKLPAQTAESVLGVVFALRAG